MKRLFLFLSLLLAISQLANAQESDTTFYWNGRISSISFDSTYSNKRLYSYTTYSKSGEVNYIDKSIRNMQSLQIDNNYIGDFECAFANLGNYSYTKEFYNSGKPSVITSIIIDSSSSAITENYIEKTFYRSGELQSILNLLDQNGKSFQYDTSFNKSGQITYLQGTDDTADFSISQSFFKDGGLKSKWIFDTNDDTQIDSSWNKKGLLYNTSLWDSIFTLSKYHSEHFDYYDNGALYEHIRRIDCDSLILFWVRHYHENGVLKEERCSKIKKKLTIGLVQSKPGHINLDSIQYYKEVPNHQFMREYFDNGALKNEYYIDHKYKFDSLFYTYYETGELLGILEYQNSKLLNAQYFNKDGSTMESGNLKNGNGSLTMYENGYAMRKCKFKNGRAKCKCD